MCDRQLTQEDGIKQAENGGVGADAESQREHRDSRETGAAPHQPKRVAKVVPEHILLEEQSGREVPLFGAAVPFFCAPLGENPCYCLSLGVMLRLVALLLLASAAAVAQD